MKKIDNNLKVRGIWFDCVFYGQEDELLRALLNAQQYCYILHNQDDEDDHYHIILNYSCQRTVSAVLRDFVSYSNCFVEKLVSIPGSFEYLTHENDPDKYHYNLDRVVYSSPSYWTSLYKKCSSNEKSDEMDCLCDDLLALARHTVSIRTLACKYGRDFIRNYRSYCEFGQYLEMEARGYSGFYQESTKGTNLLLNNDEEL